MKYCLIFTFINSIQLSYFISYLPKICLLLKFKFKLKIRHFMIVINMDLNLKFSLSQKISILMLNTSWLIALRLHMRSTLSLQSDGSQHCFYSSDVLILSSCLYSQYTSYLGFCSLNYHLLCPSLKS